MAQGYYRPEDIPRIQEEFHLLNSKYDSVLRRIAKLTFRTERGKEMAYQGFLRRANLLHRCASQVFLLLPPDLEGIPDRDTISDATLYLQAFYMNLFGACDNLAWGLVLEKDIRKKGGEELPATWVGLRDGNSAVRAGLSAELLSVLKGFDDWLEHVDAFRHSLAHRVPLYVPPYVINESDDEEYERLERLIQQADVEGRFGEMDALKAEQRKLAHFCPWFSHSFIEHSPQAVIHPQMIADLGAIFAIGEAVACELDGNWG